MIHQIPELDEHSSQRSAVRIPRSETAGLSPKECTDHTDAVHEFYRRREPDAAAEEFIGVLVDENGLNHGVALSVLGTILEHRHKIPGYGKGGDDVARVRAAVSRVHEIQERAFLLLDTYSKENHGDRDIAWRCVALLLDFKSVAGADSLKALVVACGGEISRKSEYKSLKQRVNKCLQTFQKKIPELPLLPGQRGYVARNNMRLAANDHWHGKTKS